jgi:two-component system, NarL family, sensor kinase
VSGVLAAGLFGVTVAEVATAVAVALVRDISFSTAVGDYLVTNGPIGLAFGICGGLLAFHRPRNPIGWLFLAGGVGYAMSAAALQLVFLGAQSGWPLGALRFAGTLFDFPWTISIGLCLPVAMVLFPDGRTAGPRWRWLLWAAIAEGVLFTAMNANPAPQWAGDRLVSIYLSIPVYSHLSALWTAANICYALVLGTAIASQVVRYRRGDDQLRRQLLWLLLADVVVLGYAGVAWGVFGSGPILGLLVIPLIPAAITIAILRHQLLDIKLVVSRALVYGLLTAAAAAAYVGVVALLDSLVRSKVSLSSAIVASLIVAIGFNPARVRLQDLIDRALYGHRRDPVRAVSRVGEQLTTAGAAGLAGVLEALCESLRLPFAAVRCPASGGTPDTVADELAAHGRAPDQLHSVELRYAGASIGELVVGLRSGQGRLGPLDISVLELLAGPLAVAVHATLLSVALQESRLSIVTAREEERRRLRRDLHDGLGPALTGIAFKADAARNRLADTPAEAGRLLGELRGDATEAIADIRRLVYALRPPAIDDLGLVGSLRQHSALLVAGPGGRRLAVALEAPADLPQLPAAVEVAAYRIITEALTNAARHSGASSVRVLLALAEHGGLRIEVHDDGPGRPDQWQPGVGLTSMRERAAELGGTFEAGPGPEGGGRVSATIPLDGLRAERSLS